MRKWRTGIVVLVVAVTIFLLWMAFRGEREPLSLAAFRELDPVAADRLAPLTEGPLEIEVFRWARPAITVWIQAGNVRVEKFKECFPQLSFFGRRELRSMAGRDDYNLKLPEGEGELLTGGFATPTAQYTVFFDEESGSVVARGIRADY